MLGELKTAEIEEVLNEQFLGRIACHDNDNDVTYIVPVSYAYDGKYVYGFSKNGMKVDIMRKNPKVCFEVESLRDMANWKTVIGWGIFKELTDETEREEALRILLNRHLPMISSVTTHLSEHWPFLPSDVNTIEGIVYRIDLDKKTGRFENMQENKEGLNSIKTGVNHP